MEGSKLSAFLVRKALTNKCCFRSPYRSTVCMLTPTREAVGAAVVYGREKLWPSYVIIKT